MIPLNAIESAGSYVCEGSGYLLRVPTQAVAPGVRTVNLIGSEPLFVTKISDDPDLPVTRARQVATSLHLKIGF